MTLLAYIDVRPLWFIGGLPLFIGLSMLLCWLAKARFKKSNATLFSALLFTVLFTFFLTGFGPFVDQKEVREYTMTWETKPRPSNGLKESEVVLTFVDFPSHFIGDYSDELAAHLQTQGQQSVKVVFEVISDYGRVRCFHQTEIGGLRSWKSEWGYAGSSGSHPTKSPWN